MSSEPLDRLFEAEVVQVDDQVDGAAAAGAAVPVHELGSGDREDTLWGVPLALIVWVGLSCAATEHRFQRNSSDLVGEVSDLPKRHGSGGSLGRKLTHCFLLMTWLFSVSRSMRAAVR